jgi:hypothetical protein
MATISGCVAAGRPAGRSIDRDPDGFLLLRLNADPAYRESVPQ